MEYAFVRYVATPAQEELRDRIRAFLADASPPEEVRRVMETDLGYDAAVWDELVSLGFATLPVADQAVVLEEAGAVLLCAPLLGTWLARVALAELVPPDPGGPAIPGADLAGPESVVSLAVAEDSGSWAPAGVQLQATRSAGSGWRLDGHKSFVLDGHAAETILVAGRTRTGIGWFAVDGDGRGVGRARLPTVDRTRRLARLDLDRAPARRLDDEGTDGTTTLERVMQVAATALAAEQVGGAGRCLAMTVEHARRRVQFGRPIGTFQAVQHRCADMLLELESARSAAAWAVHAASRRPGELPLAAAAAKARCSEAYAFVATETVHLHGGLGFSWDHDAHLYFKRARSSQLLFGGPRDHRERLFRLLDL